MSRGYDEDDEYPSKLFKNPRHFKLDKFNVFKNVCWSYLCVEIKDLYHFIFYY